MIHTGDIDGSVAPPKSALRPEGAQQRDDRRASFMPDDSWIDVKNKAENKSEVRVIPHEVAEKRRPRSVRQQDGHKESTIAKALNRDRRKGPQGKPDSSSMKGPQGQPDSSGMKGRQGQLESIVLKGPQGRPTSSTKAPPTVTNDPDVRSDLEGHNVRSICEGHPSQCTSSIFGV